MAVTERDRERWAALARFGAETARNVGDGIIEQNTEIVTRKVGRANFATAADHAAEEAILKALAARTPDVPVLAEERADDTLRKAERLWVVDPIDGTLNFSRGIPFYCVAIGYVEGGAVRAAAVHAPRTGETFCASWDRGSTRNGLALRVSTVAKTTEAYVVASLGFKEAARPGSRFAQLNAASVRLRVLGSAVLELCYVAMGRFDLMVHSALSPWDIAPPTVIAREAGARIVSLRTGEDAAWDESQVIVGNPALVKDALATLNLKAKPKSALASALGLRLGGEKRT